MKGRDHFEKTWRRWEDNIVVDLKEIRVEWEMVGWIDLAQDGENWWGLVKTVIKLLFL
jgi:hypothetical protein